MSKALIPLKNPESGQKVAALDPTFPAVVSRNNGTAESLWIYLKRAVCTQRIRSTRFIAAIARRDDVIAPVCLRPELYSSLSTHCLKKGSKNL